MGFINEIKDEIEKERQAKEKAKEEIRFLKAYGMSLSPQEEDRILNPQDYDDWGQRCRFTS